MHIFIQVLNYDLWSIITNGPHTPTIMIDGIVTSKSEKDWDDLNKRMVQLNAKAINIFYYSLDVNEFNKI